MLRTDIQGLRGIAVLGVLLFHAGTGWLGGGFTGVDIFFVISGYLIFKIIFDALNENRFSLVVFFSNRIKRLYPAFLFFIAASGILSVFILLPPDFGDTNKSVSYSLLQIVNVYFKNTTGYFHNAAVFKPFLHLWSICVEWQFYVLFTLFVFAVFKIGRRLLRVSVYVLLFASFMLSFYVFHDKVATFYLPQFRIWEFLIGSCLVFLNNENLKPTVANTLVILGYALIIVPFIVYGFIDNLFFPGPAALPSCLGCAAIIYAFPKSTLWCKKILENRFLTFTGDISYSLYLIHWPLLTFYRIYNVGNVSYFVNLLILAASFLISMFSLKYIENPIRRRKFRSSSVFCSMIIASVLVFFLYTYLLPKFTTPLTPDQTSMITYAYDQGAGGNDMELIAALDGKLDYLILGDSHTAMYRKLFTEIDQQYGLKGFVLGMPNFLFGSGRVEGHTQNSPYFAKSQHDLALNLVKKHSIERVILSGRWSWYIHGYLKAHNYTTRDRTLVLLDEQGKTYLLGQPHTPEEVFKLSLKNTISTLQDAGVKEIWITLPLPELSYSGPMMAARAIGRAKNPNLYGPEVRDYVLRNAEAIRIIEEYFDKDHILDLPGYLLSLSDVPDHYPLVYNNVSLYKDFDHLTYTGTKIVFPIFEPIIQSLQAEHTGASLSQIQLLPE